MRATLLAATLVMAILMVGCGEERAGQGGRHESPAEPRSTPRAKQAQPKKPETGKGEVANKPSQEQQKPEPQPASRNIPGLTPQDVYLNLEDRGFECSEPELMGPENEVRWTCEKQVAKGEYLAEIHSSDANSVRLLQAEVTSFEPARADALAQDFLGYMATVPYEGAQPEEAKAWVERNVGSKSSAEFGGVSYTLDGKEGRRFLKLEKLEG